MLNIPEDLYPIPPIRTIQHIIDEYIEFTCKTFPNDFPSNDSLIEYLTRMISPRDAENFLEICSYLYRLTQQQDTSIRLVLLISLIEKITSIKYPNLQSWFNETNSEVDEIIEHNNEKLKESSPIEIKKIIKQEIIDKFYEKYGTTKSFADFIQKYVNHDDQFRLITGFQFFRKNVPLNYTSRHEHQPQVNTIPELISKGISTINTHVPRCFDWKMCLCRSLACEPSEGCLVQENHEYFNKTIRSLSKKIYTMRSEIVHNASNKHILEGSGMATFSYILIDGKSVVVTLTIDQIQKIISKALKNYFDKKLIPTF